MRLDAHLSTLRTWKRGTSPKRGGDQWWCICAQSYRRLSERLHSSFPLSWNWNKSINLNKNETRAAATRCWFCAIRAGSPSRNCAVFIPLKRRLFPPPSSLSLSLLPHAGLFSEEDSRTPTAPPPQSLYNSAPPPKNSFIRCCSMETYLHPSLVQQAASFMPAAPQSITSCVSQSCQVHETF